MALYKTRFLKGLRTGDYEPIYFSEFVDYLKRARDDEHKFLLLTAYLTGLRGIEAKKILKQDVMRHGHYIRLRIHTAKRGVTRFVLLPARNPYMKEFMAYVEKQVFPKAYLFPSFAKVRNIRHKFRKANYEARIGRVNDETGELEPFSFYTFRHNILTLLSEYGADILDIDIYKGAKLSRAYGSAVYYIHRSANRMQKIAKIINKIMKT